MYLIEWAEKWGRTNLPETKKKKKIKGHLVSKHVPLNLLPILCFHAKNLVYTKGEGKKLRAHTPLPRFQHSFFFNFGYEEVIKNWNMV